GENPCLAGTPAGGGAGGHRQRQGPRRGQAAPEGPRRRPVGPLMLQDIGFDDLPAPGDGGTMAADRVGGRTARDLGDPATRMAAAPAPAERATDALEPPADIGFADIAPPA